VRRRPLLRTAVRLVLIGGVAAGVAGCGAEPPQPLPTAPPGTPGSDSAAPSGGVPSVPGLPTAGLPSGGLSSGGRPGGGLPGGGVPSGGLSGGGLPGGGVPTLPTAAVPTYPLPTAATPTTPPSPTPSPAGRCTSGPTGQQVLAVIKGNPGIPDKDLVVDEGPYCSGGWQFTEVEIAGQEDQVDPLLVVTKGRPTALELVEAGADVCSDKVQTGAPPGIRVRACGS
jgi:hypothetical protein